MKLEIYYLIIVSRQHKGIPDGIITHYMHAWYSYSYIGNIKSLHMDS